MTENLDALAPLAWNQFWQLTAVAIVAGLMARLLGRDRPRLAYAIWMLVVVKALTPPIWSSPTGVFSWALAIREPAPAAQAEFGPFPIIRSESPAVPTPAETVPIMPADDPIPMESILLGLWGAGLVVLLISAIGKQAACSILIWRSSLKGPEELDAALDKLRRRFGIRRRVDLVVSSRPIGPAAFGLLRPSIVLPEILLAGKAPEQVELILVHELIHIRRGDILAGYLQLAAQILWWFHPLVWWANREAARERERCCDREVVDGIGCRPATYARTLLSVVELKSRLRIPAASPGVRAMEVTSRRLESIMKPVESRGRWGNWLSRVAFACGAILLMPGAGLTLPAGADEKSKTDAAKAETRAEDPPKETKELKEAREKLKWAEAMHKKGYVRKGQLDAARLKVQELTLPRAQFEKLKHETELQQAEEKLKWAEEMHKKGHASEAQVEAARLDLMKLRLPRTEYELLTLKADLKRAEDRVEWARKMHEKKYVSEAQLESEEQKLRDVKSKLEKHEAKTKRPAQAPVEAKPKSLGKVKIIEAGEDQAGHVLFRGIADNLEKKSEGVTLKGVAREKGTGRPVVGAMIWIEGTDRRVPTDHDGHFEFVDVPEADEYTVVGGPTPSDPFFDTSTKAKVQKGQKTISADIEFVRGIALRVRVLDRATGKPLLDKATGKSIQGGMSYFAVAPNNPVKHGVIGGTYQTETGLTSGAISEAYKVDGEYRGAVLPGPGIICFETIGRRKQPDPTDHKPVFVFPDGEKAVRLFADDARKLYMADLPIRGRTDYLSLALNRYTAVIAINPKEGAKEVVYEIKLDQAEASK